MRDYKYYIPGYTGFVPDMENHFGERYGSSTRKILRERPQDLLKERLSAVRHQCHRGKGGGRMQGGFSTPHNCYANNRGMDRCGYTTGDSRNCRERGNCDREGPMTVGFVCPAYIYIEKPNQMHNMYNQEEGYFNHRHNMYGPEGGRGDYNRPPPQTYRPEPCRCNAQPQPQYNNRARYEPQPPKMRQRTRPMPYRQCGVIPKYTGHIPAMQFIFGEPYGQAADRLLKRHQDNLRRVNLYM